MCKRGDIYFVDFGRRASGSLQCGPRPVMVVSNDMANTYSPVVTIIPLTGRANKKRSLPTHVLIPAFKGSGLTRPSLALAEQLTSIEKDRLTDYRGYVNDELIMAQVTKAMQVQIGAMGTTD